MGYPVKILKFGRFQVHPHCREMLMEGAPVRLGDRAFDILLMLIEARGELVTKEALVARVWPASSSRTSTFRCRFGVAQGARSGTRSPQDHLRPRPK